MARTDELIKKDVIDQLVWDDRTDASKISVEVSNGTVTLRGDVPTYLSMASAEDDALSVIGVSNVRNQLVVLYPPAVHLPEDDEIKNTVMGKLGSDPNLDLLDLDVTVSAGNVTIKGSVDRYWKKVHAEEIAALEPGVISIENHIAVVPTEDFIDKEIASDIINSLERKALVDADEINVRVKDGEVRLTGTVPDHAARRSAYESAMFTSGVTSIEDRLTVSAIR